MKIYFYNFAKKENSTAQPTGAGTEYSCSIKTPSSLLSPIIELNINGVPGFNYCYIPDFNRYYYITSVTYNRGLWEMQTRVDVLASFKTAISTISLFVTRSSYAKTGSLIDTLYPATGDFTQDVNIFEYGNLCAWSGGKIVLCVINGNSTTGMTAYQFAPTEFAKFLVSLSVTGTDMSESVWDSLSQSIKVTTYEPLRYIGACYWFPDAFSEGTAVTSLKLGNFTASGFTCAPIYTAASPKHINYTLTLPKHPQAATRGKFCNLAPFTEYVLQLSSFGNIKLDTTALVDATSITVDIIPDPFTGMARAVITNNNGYILGNVAAQWGVPLQISSTGTISISNGLQVVGGAIGTVAGAISGDVSSVIGGISSTVKGIGDIAKGSFDTVGSTGAIIDHQTNKVLYSRFFTIADDDNTNNGRPYCKVATPSTIPGYIEAQKGIFADANATSQETNLINNYLESGFYYE